MEINGISGNVSTPPVAKTPAALTPTKPEAIPPQHDSVHLTGTALVKSLKQSGLTVAQIAQKMGLDVKTVDGYLGIATKAATTTPTPPTTAPQVKQAATDSAATRQPYSPMEEVTEPATQKATETLQGKK